MKLWILLSIMNVSAGLVAWGQSNESDLSVKTVRVNVDISSTKLKWSRADYSSPVVKVLVPDLADVTILDHRNTGEGAPCMATYEAESPEQVIQGNPAVEVIPMTITLKKVVTPDLANQRCQVTLTELIEGQIRGFKFVHERALPVGERHLDDCR